MTRTMRRYFLVFGLILVAAAGCKKKEEGGTVSGKAGTAAESQGVMMRLPESASAYIHVNTRHPAYARWKASPWYSAQDKQNTAALDQVPQMKQLVEALKRSGVDLYNPAEMEQMALEGVMFVAGTKQPGEGDMPVGMVFQAKDAQYLEAKLNGIRKAMSEQKLPVSDLQLPGVKAFKSDLASLLPAEPKAQGPRMLVIGWANDMGFATMSAELAADVAQRFQSPAASPLAREFDGHAAELPNADARFVNGYVEMGRLMNLVPEAEKQQLKDLPVRAVVFGFGMAETPEGAAKVVIEPKNDQQKRIMAALGSPTSPKLFAVVPEQPLFFLSIDAHALAEAGESQEGGQLAMLKDANRIAIAAKAAPAGQAMLPLPEAVVAIDTAKPDDIRTQIEGMVAAMLGGSESAQWTEQKMGDTSVRKLAGAMGLTAVSASTPGMYLFATSENQMKNALANLKTGTPAQRLGARARTAFEDKRGVASLYMDMVQFASFLQSMQGLLQMFAPQQSQPVDTQSLNATIESLRKLGTLSASVTAADNAVLARFFYDKPAAPVQ